MTFYRVLVQGMTCTGCEKHVSVTLENIGAKNIEVNFRKGEAVFELPNGIESETAKKAIANTKYQPVDVEELQTQGEVQLGDEVDYDYIIIGSGASAFSSAIEAVNYGAKVAMIERGTVGGTCVNIGCVPSKTLLRAGEINSLAKNNPFMGIHTSASRVELASLINQKNGLVNDLRNHKYVDLIDEYGFELIKGEAKFVDDKTIEVNGKQLTAKH